MDMDILGSETHDTIIVPVQDDNVAAHRYESIPIENKDHPRNGKTESSELPVATTSATKTVDDVISNIKLPQVEQDENEESINYGYHPIIDFFGNFRFDAAA